MDLAAGGGGGGGGGGGCKCTQCTLYGMGLETHTHGTTGESPAQLVFGHLMCSHLDLNIAARECKKQSHKKGTIPIQFMPGNTVHIKNYSLSGPRRKSNKMLWEGIL